MDIRTNNHIKVIKSSVTKKIEKLTTSPFFEELSQALVIDVEKLQKRRFMNIDLKFLVDDNVPNPNEMRKYVRILLDIKYAYSTIDPDKLRYKSIFDLLKDINSTIWHNQNTFFKRKSWANKHLDQLLNIMLQSGLLSEEKNKIINTKKGDDFAELFQQVQETIPFDWNDFIDNGYMDTPLDKRRHNNSIDYLDIQNNKYALEIDKNSKNIGKQLNSAIFYQNTVSNPSEKSISPAEFIMKKSEKSDVLQYLFDSVRNADIEMVPSFSADEFSVFEGTINDRPVFVSLDTLVMKHIRNVYGSDLRVALDYQGMVSGPAKNEKIGRLHFYDNNNNVIFSCTGIAQLSSYPDKKEENDYRKFLNTACYAYNSLLSSSEPFISPNQSSVVTLNNPPGGGGSMWYSRY